MACIFQRKFPSGGIVNPKKGWVFMTLRLPEEVVNKIDFIKKDEVLLSRTSWIITAIKKRLENEYGLRD